MTYYPREVAAERLIDRLHETQRKANRYEDALRSIVDLALVADPAYAIALEALTGNSTEQAVVNVSVDEQ